MIKTAVIGASGYIGRHLWAAYRARFPDCVGTSFSRPGDGLVRFDIRKPDLAALRLEQTGHEAVVIASACPLIKQCEDDKAGTRAVNVDGTLELMRQLAKTPLAVVFLSSDYVFPGEHGPHDDSEPPRPSTEYGRHKALVEAEVPKLTPRHLILRLSKIFGLERGDGTLLDEMARSLAEGREVKAAADQFFCPTHIDDLTAAVLAVQERRLTGVMNLASPEIWSRHGIALELARAMRADAGLVKKISLYDIPSMAGRPLDTSMRCTRLKKEAVVVFRPLRDCIERIGTSFASAHAGLPARGGE